MERSEVGEGGVGRCVRIWFLCVLGMWRVYGVVRCFSRKVWFCVFGILLFVLFLDEKWCFLGIYSYMKGVCFGEFVVYGLDLLII